MPSGRFRGLGKILVQTLIRKQTIQDLRATKDASIGRDGVRKY